MVYTQNIIITYYHISVNENAQDRLWPSSRITLMQLSGMILLLYAVYTPFCIPKQLQTVIADMKASEREYTLTFFVGQPISVCGGGLGAPASCVPSFLNRTQGE